MPDRVCDHKGMRSFLCLLCGGQGMQSAACQAAFRGKTEVLKAVDAFNLIFAVSVMAACCVYARFK